MIFIITGKTGHGKSAYMTNWARIRLKAGQRIFSNIKFWPKAMGLDVLEGDIQNKEDRENPDVKILYWSNFSDWEHFAEGTVFCDEGLIYFNARLWDTLPESMTRRFVQHRKLKTDLIFNVQHYSFIDKQLRVLCERFINCELKLGSPNFKYSFIPRIAKVVEIDLPTLNRCENLGIDPYNVRREEAQKYNIEHIWSEWFWISHNKLFGDVFSWYDTSYEVLPSRPNPLIHLQRLCNTCSFKQVRHA